MNRFEFIARIFSWAFVKSQPPMASDGDLETHQRLHMEAVDRLMKSGAWDNAVLPYQELLDNDGFFSLRTKL